MKKKMFKRAVSSVLALAMLASLTPAALAEEEYNGRSSYFDFDASEYEVAENGELSIKIMRFGEGNAEADVMVKVADVLSTYGEDYVVTNEKGKEFEQADGTKPELEDFVFEPDVLEPDEEEETVSEEEEDISLAAENEEEAEKPSENENKASYSTGSDLLDAANTYLNIVPGKTDDESKDAIEQTLDEMHNYFLDAEGAQGFVHFDTGETEKVITVKPVDNDKTDSARVFAIALLATGDELTTVGANATTYVNLVDDEDVIPARYSLSADRETLTAENPTAEITVYRTEGYENFTTAYLSTVQQTAADDAYESFSYKAVSFVPNETEKKITVSALDFSKGGKFGVRVESDDENAKFDTYYIDFTIESENGEIELSAAEDGEVELMASTVLGNQVMTLDNQAGAQHNRLGPSSYWVFSKTGSDNDNKAYYSGSDPNSVLHVQQFDKGKYSMGRTNSTYNLTGIYKLRGSMQTWSNHSKYNDIDTYFTISTSANGIDNNTKSLKVHGKTGWTERDLDVADANGSYYIKFYAYACASGYHNPHAELDWLHRYYTRYDFKTQPAAEKMYRDVYDFTRTGSDSTYPLVSNTYYDDSTNLAYGPEIRITYSNNDVSGFYANSGNTVTISPKDTATMEKYGLELDSVYFTKSSVSAADLYNAGTKKYKTSNVHNVKASGNKATVTLNQTFVSTLMNKGVVNTKSSASETINVYPVFKHKTVKVTLKNADASSWTQSNEGSYFQNVIDAWKSDGSKTSAVSSGTVNSIWKNGSNGYSFYVPKYSVIRAKYQPLSTRMANGISYLKSGSSGTTYYVAGQTSYSLTNSSGDIIANTDTSIGEVVADNDVTITPKTGAQEFYVGYSPKSQKDILAEVGTLRGAVFTDDITEASVSEGKLTDDMIEALVSEGKITNKDGYMYLNNPYIGKNYSFTGIPPEGYYVSWVNMTGDTDKDGVIDKTKGEGTNVRQDREKSKNSKYLIGNRINVTQDLDNMIYYYKYVGKSDRGGVTKTGKVVRKNNTFYGLTHGYSNKGTVPEGNARVNIAGFEDLTDMNGKYSIKLNGIDDWGAVSVSVSTEDGFTYPLQTSIETTGDTITLPVFDNFNPKSTTATYEKKTGSANGTAIAVEDDKLTVTASVTTSSAVTPTAAKFYIYRGGMVYKDLSDKEEKNNYTTTFRYSGGEYIATITFNPKTDFQSGDLLYVSFADQNGNYGHAMDMGYSFVTPLTLETFVMPLIGSESLDDFVKTAETWDIIGSPLQNLMTGPLKGVERSATYAYTPDAVLNQYGEGSEQAQKYSWTRSDYTFGWSKTFGDKKKIGKSKGKAGETEVKETLNAVDSGDLKGKDVKDSKYATKGKFSWSVTPEVGFKLTLSTRGTKNYFEDLVFYVGVNAGVKANQKISLPYGFNVLICEELDVGVVGVYHMYNDYTDLLESYEDELTEYDAANFGLFKSFSNSVRREGYIFIDPKIVADLGVGWTVIDVNGIATFTFDMDFRFTEQSIDTYGTMNIDLDWGIKLFSFQIYSSDIDEWNIEIFRSKDQNGHIDFDYKNGINLAGILEETGEYSLDKVASRDYLSNRSEWMGEGYISLMSDASEGTEERILRKGTADNPRVRMAKISEDELLMVFVDDDANRDDMNSRAVFYSIYTDGAWSKPEILEDDGQMDGAPEICDLGDKVLVAWAGLDHVLTDGESVIDALRACDIHTVFYDKAKKSFGDIEILTHTTDKDTTADTMPRASYDKETGKLILYYTKMELPAVDTAGKTEEEIAKEQLNFNKVVSVGAYLFYDDENGWQTGDVYGEDELTNLSAAEREEYVKNYYGQRFLDLRIDKNGELPRMVDSDAASFDGKSLYAWTIDWDGDINTLYDRDVFMQIYSFADDKFTPLIRVTENSSYYAAPKFAHSDNATYLFYGTHDGTDAENAEDADTKDKGEIVYLNLNKVYENGGFTMIQNGANAYYDLKYTQEAISSYDKDNNLIATYPEQVVWVDAEKAADCDNISDYSLFVGPSGNILLFWTETENGGRQVKAAMYSGEEDSEEEDASPEYDNDYVSDEDTSVSGWSQPFTLTHAEENIYYTGISGAAIKAPGEEYGKLYVVGGKGNHNDESDTAQVLLVHTPYSKAEITEVAIDTEYPRPGDAVKVTAKVENSGMIPYDGEVSVEFAVNGGDTQTVKLNRAISGGETVDIDAYMTIPDKFTKLDFTAKLNDGEAVSKELTPAPQLYVSAQEVAGFVDSDADNTYRAEITNEGNADASKVKIDAVISDNESVGSQTVDTIAYGDTEEISLDLDIADDKYTIDENGIGVVPVTVTVTMGDEEISSIEANAVKYFDADAVKYLKNASAEDKTIFNVTTDFEGALQPALSGDNGSELTVFWLESSDTDVAYIDMTNAIITAGAGTTTLKGVLAPNKMVFDNDEDGNAVLTDWNDLIPSNMVTEVTATVNVTDAEEAKKEIAFEDIVADNAEEKTEEAESDENLTPYAEIRFKDSSGNVIIDTTVNSDDTASIDNNYGTNGIVAFYTTPAGAVRELSKDEFKKVISGESNELPLSKAFSSLTFKIYNDSITSTQTAIKAADNTTKETTDIADAVEKVIPTPTPTVRPSSGGGGGSLRIRATATPAATAAPEETADPNSTAAPEETQIPAVSGNWFNDVPQSAWYYSPVKYAFDNGLMNGVTDDEFAPDMDITRGMFVTVLHRMENEPKPEQVASMSFADVEGGAYYADAVAWANENGIVEGYSDTEFAPEDKITREQIAAIIYRYAKYKGEEGMVGSWMFLLDFADREDISEYAYEALCWNTLHGLIEGFEDNTVRPKANTTRAQAAAILERFVKRDNENTEENNGEEQSFEIAPLEGEPSDYSDSNNWINIPEITKDVDTIYFYPTAYNEVGDDVAPICDIDNENMRKGAVDIYNKQATAFEESTNVFAPYYRQTNINALSGKSAEEFDTIQRGVQRTDMYASLDYYFDNYNNGRPFIIAGHSQGAQMIKIALGEYFNAHPEYRERMVAAYPIGYSFTNEWLEENGYKFAEGADDIGVIVSWNTEGPENKAHESSVVLPGALAINPINWKRDDTYASKEENLGSLVINDKGEQEIVPGLNDAQIDSERGVVICTTSDAFVPMPEIFGPASLHGQDYGLYYANIGENAKTRIDAYMKQK